MQKANHISDLIIHNTEYSFLQKHDFISYAPGVIAEKGNDGNKFWAALQLKRNGSQNEVFRMEWLKMQADGNPKGEKSH